MLHTPVSDEDLRIMMISVHLSQAGESQAHIAEQLGLTPSMVSRLMARARDFIQVQYNVPGDEQLEAQLMARFNLADAVVVETGLNDMATEVVGQAAARYFVRHVGSGSTVAVSCGETLLEMLKALPTRRSLKIGISQLSIESDPGTIHQAPATLVGLLRAKSSPDSDVCGIQIPSLGMAPGVDAEFRRQLAGSGIMRDLHARARRSDKIWLGVGVPYRYGRREPQSFLRMVSSVMPIKEFERIAKGLGVVGELNNQVFDEDGRDRTGEIHGLSDVLINLLSLEEIRAIAAKRSERRVVLIATGPQKAKAIKVAVRSGLANVLITGRSDAARLLL